MVGVSELWKEVENEIERFSKQAIELSDWLAKNPEISEQEFEACRKHVAFLESAGYTAETPFMDIATSFSSRKGDPAGPKVCLMFEYDALPGIGHGCGHNVSGAMSGLAAAGLSRVMDRIKGELVLVGTPAEETNGSKVVLAEKGVFDGMDLAMMIHSSDIFTYAGYRSLAMDAIEFRFTGKPAHAAGEPWAGRNALNGVQLLFHAIDMLRQHIIPEARIHGIISEGGLAPNIVPEHAGARFYIRAPKRPILDQIVSRIYDCALGAAQATETEVTWRNFEYSFDDMLKNDAGEKFVEDVLKDLGVPIVPSLGTKGSSDVGNVSYRCPALQPKLSIVNEEMASHTHEFAEATLTDSAHEALVTGARVMARTALAVFLDDDLRWRIRKDFEKEKQEAQHYH